MTSLPRTVRSAVAAVALLAPLVVGVSTASAGSHYRVEYDALGDSFASGFGAPPYEQQACGRSDDSYPEQLDRLRRIYLDDFVACAGATTATLVSGGQLDALDRDTDLVTISIGGNDIGWSNAVGACLLLSDAECAGALAATSAAITNVLPGLLHPVYSQVSDRTRRADVVVTGYPRLFSPEYGVDVLGASRAEQVALNKGADLLNDVIAKAAAEHCFEFVDVTDRFAGHGVNSPDPWILGPLDPAAFHPTLAGYTAYTAAVIEEIRGSRPS